MSQYVDNHSLAQDHPESKDAIHEMKMSNAHFSRILEKYEKLDKEIVRMEQGLEPVSDLELDTLKLSRVQLKDDLMNQLQKAKT
ncbi:MAG: hypothetical protein ACI8VW_003436 [bacterium]|jgi:uncharacterized protein YdcH (DUF465 family)